MRATSSEDEHPQPFHFRSCFMAADVEFDNGLDLLIGRSINAFSGLEQWLEAANIATDFDGWLHAQLWSNSDHYNTI